MSISVVIPVFNELESLPVLIDELKINLKDFDFWEIIFVDDGSSDGSTELLSGLCLSKSNYTLIQFHRNYGKSAALSEGFRVAKGDCVITMDADLQDDPSEIKNLVSKLNEGWDLVSGWKKTRLDPLNKRLPSKIFNFVLRLVTGVKIHDFNCGLKAYKNMVVKKVKVSGEMHRYIPVLVKMAGFKKIGEQIVQHQARKYGTTKFGLSRFVNGMLDLITLSLVSRFERRPMHFFGTLGTFMFVASGASLLAMGILKLYRLAQGMRPGLVADDPWFYIFLTAMVLGTQLFVTGLLAELMVRQSSKKVNYSISEVLNIKE